MTYSRASKSSIVEAGPEGINLESFGINFEDDEWVLRRQLTDGIVENLRLNFSHVALGWKEPIKRYIAHAMLGRLARSTRYAHVIYERYIVLRSFADWCYQQGVDSPQDLGVELVSLWTAASRVTGRWKAGATRTRAKFIEVEDFLLNEEGLSPDLCAEIIRVGRRLAREASLAASRRSTSIDVAEEQSLAFLADAIRLVEEDGAAIATFLELAASLEVGRLTSGGRRTAAFRQRKRDLPIARFRSAALRYLDPREGSDEQRMLKIAEGAAVLIIAMLSSMRPSEIRRLTTMSAKPIDDLESVGSSGSSAIIAGVLSKSRRRHEWVAAPAVLKAIELVDRLGRPIREEVGTNALFVLAMYRGRRRAAARDVHRVARVDRYSALRSSMRAFVEASMPGFDTSKITFRLMRKFLARFIARRDRSSLGALAYQYGHLETKITDTYYVGLDSELSTLLAEENANEVVGAMDDLISSESIYTNLPTSAVAESLSRIGDVLERASTSSEVMKLLGSGVVLGPCDWGYCFYRENRSRCEGDGSGPNPAKRSPSTCAGCLNFTATAKHAPWWELRRQDLVSFLSLRGIPEQSRLIAQERLASVQLILNHIGAEK